MPLSTKDYSSIQEHKVADALGWEVVTGSGARDCHPGDIRSNDWLGECKTHTKPGHQIIFKLSVWQKISKQAQSKFKYPVLIVDDGSQKLEHTWVLFPYRRICQPDISIKPCQLKIRTNISFYEIELKSELLDADILEVKFDSDVLGITSFLKFKEMFGE